MPSLHQLLLRHHRTPRPDAEKRSLFWRKWLGFVSAVWVMAFSGSYPFSNYSQDLKEVLSINQKSLNRLGIARDLGDSLGGIVAGYLSNYLPPWVLLCFSALASVVGFGVQWLVVSQTIDPLPYWIMVVALVIGGSVMSWMNTAVFNASVRNFKRNRGPVAGLLKACMGLSSAVFATICSALFASSGSAYLLMVSTVPTTFCLISAVFFRPVPSASTPQEEQIERKSLTVFNVIALTLAIYIAITTFTTDASSTTSAYNYTTVIVLIAIIASAALVPIGSFILMENDASKEKWFHDSKEPAKEDDKPSNFIANDKSDEVINDGYDHAARNDAQGDMEGNDLTESLIQNKRNSMVETRIQATSCCGFLQTRALPWISQGVGEETSTLALCKRWHAWAIFLSMVFGCGAGASFSNNLGQIGQAFGYENASVLISLFSLGNFFGRLGSGNISEYFIRVAGLPRPAWMGLAKVPMLVCSLTLSGGSPVMLYVGSLVIGVSHGSLITLFIPIVSEFYGLKYFGTNFVVLSLYYTTGSLSLSSLSGWLYDQQAEKQTETESLTCYGSQCYGTSFVIFGVCLAIGVALDVLLSISSKQFYQNKRLEQLHLDD